jgi:hypothetical protein
MSPVSVRRLASAIVLLGLVAFYYAGATAHSRALNLARGRADQSGYLWDAVAIYHARHGGPDILIGERNRMPVYPWLLSWLYDPAMSPDDFFEVGKRWNIRLSLVLLLALWLVVRRYLPGLPAATLVLVITFGWFIFKAGYAQTELLYYFVFFLTFLACFRLLTSDKPRRTLGLAMLGGTLAAIAHLTKAAVLPLVGVFLLVLGVRAMAPLIAWWSGAAEKPSGRTVAVRGAAVVLFAICFLGVLAPYLVNSKRAFGRYFYNVNTTFYIWYDDWPAASRGTYRHGDGVGWPQMPAHEIPTLRRYLRSHTTGQIASRVGKGLLEMVSVSYTRLWYFKYVSMYLLFALALMVSCWPQFVEAVRAQAALSTFLVLYTVTYLLAMAFYQPISGTTQRMLLAHLAPLLFVLSRFFTRPPFRHHTWRIAGGPATPHHFQLLMIATIAFDLVFALRPRLLADFAGY